MNLKRMISAALAAIMLVNCSGCTGDSVQPIERLERPEFSELETVSDNQLEYLVSNVNPSEYITDFNRIDRGKYEGVPNGLYGVYFMPNDTEFEGFCMQKASEPFSWHEEVIGRETEKISETEIYAYYNTVVTTMELYTNTDGTTEKKPHKREHNFTLFLKNFDECTYTGEMTAEAVKNNFDIYLCEQSIYAREVSETEDSFVYRYIECMSCSGFWSNFYKFLLKEITIDRHSGGFTEKIILTRETEP